MKNKKINHKEKNLVLKHSEETLWQKQAFWQHRKAKRTYETFSNLLVMDTPRMPKKYLPRFIKNENEKKLEIRS